MQPTCTEEKPGGPGKSMAAGMGAGEVSYVTTGRPSAAVFPWKLPATPLPELLRRPPRLQPSAGKMLARDVTASSWEGIPGRP